MRRGIVATFLLAAATGAPSAAAAPSWLASSRVTGVEAVSANPEVAVDRGGDAITIWEARTGLTGSIESSFHPAGAAAWQAPEQLSPPAGSASTPWVAADGTGGFVAVWEQFMPETKVEVVESATRPPGGVWGAPTVISAGAAETNAGDARVAVDARGDAVAVWTLNTAGGSVVQSAYRPVGAAAWQAPTTLSGEAGAQAFNPVVRVDENGDAAAAWQESDGKNQIVHASVRPAASGAWQKPEALSPAGADSYEPQLAMNAGGGMAVVWAHGPSLKALAVEAASGNAAAGEWRTEGAISETGVEGSAVGVDAAGDAVAVWSAEDSEKHRRLRSSSRPASGTWQPPVEIATGGKDATQPEVAVDPAGDAVVVFEEAVGTEGNGAIAGVARPAGSTAFAPQAILAASNSFTPQIAIDPSGNAVAAWEQYVREAVTVSRTAAYDAAGPVLGALSIPASGLVGEALSFSSSPLDVWSPLGATTWSFGDGGTAGGTTTTHSYQRPGSYTVTITSTDALGNASSGAGTVLITQPPPATPRLSGVGLTHARFRVARAPTVLSASPRPRVPAGTAFRYTLSAAATVEIRVLGTATGLRTGRSCVAPTALLRRRHARVCRRTVSEGTLTRAGAAGPHVVPFSGRLGRRALRPGAYSAVLRAGNAGGVSAPTTIHFTILR